MKAVNILNKAFQFLVQWGIIAAALGFLITLAWPSIATGMFDGMVQNGLMSAHMDFVQAGQMGGILSFMIMLCRTKFIAW